MPRLPSWMENYRSLPRPVIHFTAGQFLINLITATQFMLLNLYLKRQGMEDPAIAGLTSHRFLAALLLAIPAGLWLRGRPLKPALLVGSLLYPLTTLLSIEAVRCNMPGLATCGFLGSGMAILLINVTSLPIALRISPPDRSSETLSLLFATWAAASIAGGLLSTMLQSIGTKVWFGHNIVFDEHITLLIVTLLALGAPLFHSLLPPLPAVPRGPGHWLHIPPSDRPLLLRAVIPTLCIATGAGLTIQFLNLFFDHVHHLSSRDFSFYTLLSNLLVLGAGLLLPEIKRRLGWRGAILGVQSVSVALLMIMGLTELTHAGWALPLALICFVLRQPLMNMAAPATSELTMRYVGEHNRELISACNGAIWSGAWWIAARSFQWLRSHEFDYWKIMMLTGLLYLVGTLAYRGLIRRIETETPSPTPEASPGSPDPKERI
ncbi:MAG TPA: MFS transporter [Luteolibacter sp.]|nr:MFS transporter [Luteolibacter sp.]